MSAKWLVQALAIALAITGPITALAEVYPTASRVDSRLRYTTYNPDQVYRLNATVLHATFIEFAKGEQMEKYYTGDSDAWEVGKHANLVAIKPKKEDSSTNLIITTNRGRVYVFELAVTDKAPMYGIRFSYPNQQFPLDSQLNQIL